MVTSRDAQEFYGLKKSIWTPDLASRTCLYNMLHEGWNIGSNAENFVDVWCQTGEVNHLERQVDITDKTTLTLVVLPLEG